MTAECRDSILCSGLRGWSSYLFKPLQTLLYARCHAMFPGGPSHRKGVESQLICFLLLGYFGSSYALVALNSTNLHGVSKARGLVYSKDQEVLNSTVLSFDDIPTYHGLAKIPSPYSYLEFFSFDVLRPRDPALADWITEHDLNCAVSSPNAIIGSRSSGIVSKEQDGASISIANATLMANNGLAPHFSLLAFYVKPMDAPPPGTTITVKGHSQSRVVPSIWHVEFISEYHLPFLVKLQEFSRQAWTELYKVEFFADYGEDRLDWEFCIDNLEIRFDQLSLESQRAERNKQKVLSRFHTR